MTFSDILSETKKMMTAASNEALYWVKQGDTDAAGEWAKTAVTLHHNYLRLIGA